jgi:hypothetical protein
MYALYIIVCMLASMEPEYDICTPRKAPDPDIPISPARLGLVGQVSPSHRQIQTGHKIRNSDTSSLSLQADGSATLLMLHYE